MIAVVLATETSINFGSFMPAAQAVTGENHVADSDVNPGLSQTSTNLNILRDFAGREMDTALLALNLGFLVAGAQHDIVEIIEYCSDLTYVRTTKSMRDDIECVLITGSLSHWRNVVLEGCKSHQMSTARLAFNNIYRILCQMGLGTLFGGRQTQERQDGTFLLLENK